MLGGVCCFLQRPVAVACCVDVFAIVLLYVVALWPTFYIFVVLFQISGTKNGHEWVFESMKSRFEPTKFEEKAMPNTMATLPGPSLATKRLKIIENR